MAYRIVAEFGMAKPLYNIFLNVSRYGYKSYSEKTNQVADAEIKKIIDHEYNRCKELVLANKDKIETIAKKLVEKEMLDVLAIKSILGDRRHESDDVSVTEALKDVENMLQQRQDDKERKAQVKQAEAEVEATAAANTIINPEITKVPEDSSKPSQ